MTHIMHNGTSMIMDAINNCCQLSVWDLQDDDIPMLEGAKVAITGRLPMVRSNAISAIVRVGAFYTNTISHNTDYLVIGLLPKGKQKTRKIIAADKLREENHGIRLLTPYDFVRALEKKRGN